MAQLSSSDSFRNPLKETMRNIASSPVSRDAFLDVFNESLLSTKGSSYMKHFDINLNKDPEMKSIFVGALKEAVSTVRGQSRFPELMKMYNIEPDLINRIDQINKKAADLSLNFKPALQRTSSDLPTLVQGERPEVAVIKTQLNYDRQVVRRIEQTEDQKLLIDRLSSTGFISRMRRESVSGDPRDKVEKIEFSFTRRSSKTDLYAYYKEAMATFKKQCPECKDEKSENADYCGHCSDDDHRVILKTKVYVNMGKNNALMESEDSLSLSSAAMKQILEKHVGNLALIREFTANVIIPTYREILELVKKHG